MIEDISPLANLSRLFILLLNDNTVSNAAPLSTLPILAQVDLRRNPLTADTVEQHIAPLLARGVVVFFDPPDDPSSLLTGWQLALFVEDAKRQTAAKAAEPSPSD